MYGYYVRQEDLINGRPWYKNDGKSIWWDDKEDNVWRLGKTTSKGDSLSYAKLYNDGRCLSKISNQKWKLSPSSHPDHSDWYDAGNKVKVRYGYKPKGKEELLKVINVMLNNNFYLLSVCK